MPQAYNILTAVIAFTGCSALIMSGELNPVMLIPGIGLFLGYYRLLRGLPPAPKRAISAFSLAALFLLIFDAVGITGDFFIAVAHMTIVFQTLKSFDLREPWDYLQVCFMSILQLVITSELTYSIAFGVIFVFFLIAFVVTIALSHFIKEGIRRGARLRRPLIYISIATVVSTALLFMAIPRVGAGVFGRKSSKGIRTVGFSEKVEFGSFGDVLLDPTVVMRVELSGEKLPLYWRGMTLDYFDGLSWKDSVGGRFRLFKTGDRFVLGDAGARSQLQQKVYIEPMDTDVVFALGEPIAVEADGRFMETDGAGALFIPAKKDRRFTYTLWSAPEGGGNITDRVWSKRRYLQLPEGIERVAALAREVSGEGKTDLEKALLIESHLRANYRYSLKTDPVPPGMSPVEDFLFSSKKGFCEYYATAMVLMLRSQGISARIVTGFLGGDMNELGNYILVRQSNAHSWVEAGIGGRWQVFDPTPVSASPFVPSRLFLLMDALRMNWYRYVVGFSSYDQRRLIGLITLPAVKLPELQMPAGWVKPSLHLLVALIAPALITLFYLRRRKHGRYGFETVLYLKWRNRIRRHGGRIGPSSTPRDVLREAKRLGMDGAAEEFIRMYEAVRFGGQRMDRKEMKRYSVRGFPTASSKGLSPHDS